MFEDETIRVACPQCGFKNQFLVREFEDISELRAECEGCDAILKIDSHGFKERLERIAAELQSMRASIGDRSRRRPHRLRAIDFQI